jgi:hypothetical protein
VAGGLEPARIGHQGLDRCGGDRADTRYRRQPPHHFIVLGRRDDFPFELVDLPTQDLDLISNLSQYDAGDVWQADVLTVAHDGNQAVALYLMQSPCMLRGLRWPRC